jgi:hypothetical protein
MFERLIGIAIAVYVLLAVFGPFLQIGKLLP